MMELNLAINNLANALVNTQEFAELKNSRNEINKNPAHTKMLDEFQKKQAMLYNQNQNLSQNQVQALMQEIDSYYKQLSEIPEINRYFIASDRFNDLMSSTMNSITDYIDKYLQYQ